MTSKRDPLLGAARLVLLVFIGAMSAGVIGLLLAVPLTFGFQSYLLGELAKKGVEAGPELVGVVALVLAGCAGLLALGVYFMMLLRRIVLSVGDGDPFIPENAVRLSRMGWLVLIGQVASIPVGAAVVWLAKLVEDAPPSVHIRADVYSDFGFSGGGILLMLVLFILARVFKRGAELQEELEGTV